MEELILFLLELIIDISLAIGYEAFDRGAPDRANTYYIFISTILLGSVFGVLSIHFLRNLLISNHSLQIAHLCIAPLFYGWLFALVVKRISGEPAERKHFMIGLIFSFTFSLSRYIRIHA